MKFEVGKADPLTGHDVATRPRLSWACLQFGRNRALLLMAFGHGEHFLDTIGTELEHAIQNIE